MLLSNNVKIRKVEAAATSADTALISDAVDMQGFDGVVFITTIATANAAVTLKAQQGNVLSGVNLDASKADLLGTSMVAGANGETLVLDIYRPTDRYVQAVVTRGAATAVGEIYAIQYGGAKRPHDNEVADVIMTETHVSPAEGTA